MNDCEVCLGNDTKIEDKVQQYPKATQPRGSMFSSAQLIYGQEGSLIAQPVQSAHSPPSQHMAWVCNWGYFQFHKGPRVFRRTLIAEVTHFAMHSCMLGTFYIQS